MINLTFSTKSEALAKFEDLYLNHPNEIYNMYFNKDQKVYLLRKESKSNG